MAAPKKVIELVERFRQNFEDYKSGSYNETQLRREFLDPFFEILGIGRYTLKKSYWFDFQKQNITGRTTNIAKLGAKPKLLLRKTGGRILATFDDSGIFPEQSLYFLFNNRSNLNFKYLLGILNSSLVNFYFRNRLVTNKRSIAQLKKIHLDEIPVPTINFSDPDEKACHGQIVDLVEQMLLLHKQLAMAKMSYEKTAIQRQIDAIDQQIDRLVYDLYGLTEEEIKIVEEINVVN